MQACQADCCLFNFTYVVGLFNQLQPLTTYLESPQHDPIMETIDLGRSYNEALEKFEEVCVKIRPITCEVYMTHSYDYQNRLQECIDDCERILETAWCPDHIQIKSHILIGSCVGDVGEAGECYREAKRLLTLLRVCHGSIGDGHNPILVELKAYLEMERSVK